MTVDYIELIVEKTLEHMTSETVGGLHYELRKVKPNLNDELPAIGKKMRKIFSHSVEFLFSPETGEVVYFGNYLNEPDEKRKKGLVRYIMEEVVKKGTVQVTIDFGRYKKPYTTSTIIAVRKSSWEIEGFSVEVKNARAKLALDKAKAEYNSQGHSPF
ncbi:MAG: hypothetical protein AABW58_00120 [Nanoarchaeota archaeon]